MRLTRQGGLMGQSRGPPSTLLAGSPDLPPRPLLIALLTPPRGRLSHRIGCVSGARGALRQLSDPGLRRLIGLLKQVWQAPQEDLGTGGNQEAEVPVLAS